MKKILPLFTITLFFFLSTHTSEESPYTVIFADGTTHQYPAAVIEQLPMVKTALENSSGTGDDYRTLGLSRSPVTKNSFYIVTERIDSASIRGTLLNNAKLNMTLERSCKDAVQVTCLEQMRSDYDFLLKASAILSDEALLETITAADYFFKGTYPSFNYFLNLLVAKTRTKNPNDRNDLYKKFTNLQAELFMLHVKKKARDLSRFLNRPLINLILLYTHGCYNPENKFLVPSCTEERHFRTIELLIKGPNKFPVPTSAGQPVLGPIPLSVQDLIDANSMPAVDHSANVHFGEQGLTSLTGLETLDLPAARRLNLYRNHLTDLEPNALKGFPNLQILDLEENKISGTSLLRALPALPALESCWCLNNPITKEEQNLLQQTFPKIIFLFGRRCREAWV